MALWQISLLTRQMVPFTGDVALHEPTIVALHEPIIRVSAIFF